MFRAPDRGITSSKTSPEPVAPIKKMDSELLPITEPEVSFRKRGFKPVGEGFLRDDLDRGLSTGAADRANTDNCNSEGNRDSSELLQAGWLA